MSGGKGGGGEVTVGFRYYFGIFMGLCRGPVDEIIACKVADSIAWQGSVSDATTKRVSINMPDLFGGEKKEGGIVGSFDVMMGEADQDVSGMAVTDILSPTFVPGFRRMCTVFYDGMIAALNPYPKKWSWRVRRAVKGWDGECIYPELAAIWLGAAEPPPAIPTTTGGSGTAYNPPVRDEGITDGVDEDFDTQSMRLAIYANTYAQLPDPKPDYDPDQGVRYNRPPEDAQHYITRLIAYNSQFPDPGIKTYTYTTGNEVDGIRSWLVNVQGNYYGEGGGGPTVPVEALVSSGQIMAMNPAHIIYEAFTNREWGRGFPRAAMNLESFHQCAITLKNEGFGLCVKWSRKDTVESFVQSILDHIGAAIYPERNTALLTLKLIRDDYFGDPVPFFDTASGILDISEATESTSSGAINEIQVTYLDPVSNEQRIVKAQNLAAIQSAGGAINSSSKTYAGLPTGELARRVAQRDLRAQVDGLRRFKVTMDRRAWSLTPGGVFRMKDVARNIPEVIVRIATVEDGTLGNGSITFTVVEDVFALPSNVFTSPELPKWTPPNFNACIGRLEVFELPYFMVNRMLTTAELATVTNDSAFFGVVAEQGQRANTSYDIAVKLGSIGDGETPTTSNAYCGYIP